jgi:hypothetical protein
MHPRFRLPLIVGLAAALTALGATAAPAGAVKHFDSTVTLAKASPFHGHVSSAKHACEANRTVAVYQQKYSGDDLYATTTTDGDGKWSIPAPGVNGKFYAKATRKAGGTYVCRPDISPTRSFSSA